MSEAPRRILVIGPSWVGDMVMAQTLFSALRAQHPDCLIDVLAPDWCRALLARMPEVRQALTLPFGHGDLRLRDRRELGRSLAGEYDQAIVLPNSFKSALLPFWARIPVRTGWRGEMRYGLLNDVRTLDKQRYPLMVQRFVALAQPADAPVPALADITPPHLRVDTSNADRTLQNMGLNQALPILALCPGAEFGPSKRWPEQYYAEVARHQLEQGWQVWIFGSPKDREVAELICDAIPEKLRWRLHLLAGETALPEAVDLLALANAVISNDSGLMHIAAALHRPLVAVYGSTSPDFTPPLHGQVETVRLGLDCSPCFKRECPLGHLNCLRELGPDQVIGALGRVLA
ncbi:ADP-heptose LPS heptosyltransferase II [Alcanivorax sp. S71-1-4]|jgi:heptosyltransferase II|uniref:lipopolysaccharide heptosyltransferase II n=1 Tax=Alcanivorax sp. S71-1-4 TaxID=1177159 RepID=UPI00135722BF|nr:lipopolysaccharide heptosyltransferase II [Alcanivorax sp. S71-1-4]KAF0805607.1 ADP-heptose LPS heptosyltransferase II [Alcanivorax sp. S71-1-4]